MNNTNVYLAGPDGFTPVLLAWHRDILMPAVAAAGLTPLSPWGKLAGTPAIVMGNDALGFSLPDGSGATIPEASDASTVAAALVQGGASAYLFDYPQANVATTVSDGAASIPAFGSGTLGYVRPPLSGQTDSLGSSAFLVVSVQTAARNPKWRWWEQDSTDCGTVGVIPVVAFRRSRSPWLCLIELDELLPLLFLSEKS